MSSTGLCFDSAVTTSNHVLQLQIPAGFVADKFEGVHVLLTGLLLWSLATGLNPLARYAANPFHTLMAMRVFLGVAQSVMMPSVSATAAKYAWLTVLLMFFVTMSHVCVLA